MECTKCSSSLSPVAVDPPRKPQWRCEVCGERFILRRDGRLVRLNRQRPLDVMKPVDELPLDPSERWVPDVPIKAAADAVFFDGRR